MKNRLRVLAVALFLCALAAGALAAWAYARARARADEGVGLQNKALQLYDQSDAFKGTPGEEQLIAEAQRRERDGDAALASARAGRFWAITGGVTSVALALASVLAILAHLRRKDADPPA